MSQVKPLKSEPSRNADGEISAATPLIQRDGGPAITQHDRDALQGGRCVWDMEEKAKEDGFSATKSSFEHKKLALEWRNLTFSVPDGNGKRKYVLQDCFGKLYPGQVGALIGPSGAGKSTLMNVLASRQNYTHIDDPKKHEQVRGPAVSGGIYYGGKPVNFQQMKDSVAFVMQFDEHMPLQTVKESLTFAARLKLPKKLQQSDPCVVDRNVEDLLRKLDLWEARDVPVGNAQIKGISGGQKKRLSVALELINRPSVLFLDEPTSGLDSHGSFELIKMMQQVAIEQGCVIVATIHQPSSELFALFDQVQCMRFGKVTFNGFTGLRAKKMLGGLAHRPENIEKFKELEKGRTAPLGFECDGVTPRYSTCAERLEVLSPAYQLECMQLLNVYLDFICHMPIPDDTNPCDWLLNLASNCSEAEIAEIQEQTARVYELTNPDPLIYLQSRGYLKKHARQPLIQYTGERKSGAIDLEALKNAANDEAQQGPSPVYSDGDDAEVTEVKLDMDGGESKSTESHSSNSLPAILDSDEAMPSAEPLQPNSKSEIRCNMKFGVYPNHLKALHFNWRAMEKKEKASTKTSVSVLPSRALKAAALEPPEMKSLPKQISALVVREFTEQARGWGSILLRILMPCLQIAVGSLAYIQAGKHLRNFGDGGDIVLDDPGKTQQKISEINNVMLTMYYALFMQAGLAQVLNLPRERPIFLREYTSKFYSLTAYLTAKMIFELAVICVAALCNLTVVYFLIALNGSFFKYYGGLVLIGMSGGSLGLLLSSMWPSDPQRGLAFAPMIMATLPNALSGNFRPLSQVTPLIRWIAYFLPCSWVVWTVPRDEFSWVLKDGNNNTFQNQPLEKMRYTVVNRFVRMREERPWAQGWLEKNPDAGPFDGQWDTIFYVFWAFAFAQFAAYRIIGGLVLKYNSRTVYV